MKFWSVAYRTILLGVIGMLLFCTMIGLAPVSVVSSAWSSALPGNVAIAYYKARALHPLDGDRLVWLRMVGQRIEQLLLGITKTSTLAALNALHDLIWHELSTISPPISSSSTGTTLTFAPGTRSLIVPNDTKRIVGNGGAHEVVIFPSVHDWYRIDRDISGDTIVSDIHTGRIVGARISGVAELRFSDGWVYVVRDRQYRAVTALDTLPGTVLYAPALVTPVGALTSIQIENHSVQDMSGRIVTFGMVFVAGDVPSGSMLSATIDGWGVRVQMDVKTRYQDGSVWTAVVSVAVPQIASHGARQVILSRTDIAWAALIPINPSQFVARGYDTDVLLTIRNADRTTSTKVIHVGEALANALAHSTTTSWLSGPLVSEVRFDVPINASLHFLFNVRATADSVFSTDVQALNDRIFSTDARTYDYSVSVKSHGQVIMDREEVHHVPMQAWHRVFLSDASGSIRVFGPPEKWPHFADIPTPLIVYDVNYLVATGMIDGYDTSLGVSSDALLAQYVTLSSGTGGLLGSRQVVRYQPATGGRPDIGPVSGWAANWIVSQSFAARRLMMASAEAAGSEPFHATDAEGDMVATSSHPNLWLDGRATAWQRGVNDFADIEKDSGWTLDIAHMPDLSYIAALTEGGEYFVDQVQSQASYDVLSVNPAYRGSDRGIVTDTAQVRGSAWTIRDLAHAVLVTPDDDPLKPYFTKVLENNIDVISDKYVHGVAGSQEGDISGYILGAGGGGKTPQVAPWQQAYLAIAVAKAARLGITDASEVNAWQNHFLTGLFLNAKNGYDPLRGTAYWLTVGTHAPQAVNGYVPIMTWRELYRTNYGSLVPTVLDGYPDDPSGGYAAIMKAAFASLWGVTHDPDDLAAYDYLTRLTPSLATSRSWYVSAQTWNITPTLLDGRHLKSGEMSR